MGLTAEELRLEEARDTRIGRHDWGPHLSGRQWGTAREDYSDSGDSWDDFTHDQAPEVILSGQMRSVMAYGVNR